MASLSPELITEIGGFPITNTIIATVVVDVVLVLLIVLVSRNIKQIPGKLQNAVESLIFYFYDMARNMAGKRAKAIFPWVMTFFIFIVVSNFLGLMPGIGSIGINPPHEASPPVAHEKSEPAQQKADVATEESHGAEPTDHAELSTQSNEHTEEAAATEKHEEKHLVSLVRPATSDFNATLALAVISLVATHVLSIRFTGIKDYLSRYFVINPIMLFVGLLELVSEFIKIFSLSFRLFGNIYAGEVVLATISGLFAFLAPLPFLLLESIVAIVQAMVFAMLTLVFMSMLTEKHHGEEH